MYLRFFFPFFLLIFSIGSSKSPSQFETAESHRLCGEYHNAIDLYLMNLEKQESPLEIWASKYNLGLCYEKLGEWKSALHWYLEAYQENTFCLDPLLNIAIHYRLQGQNDLAYIFAKHGARFFPKSDYRFDEELSIVAFYTRYKEDGYQAASDLLLQKELSWYTKETAYENILFYTQNLPHTRFLALEFELPTIHEFTDEQFSPMNPSILRTESGYKVICRAVNYTQEGAKDFHTNDLNGYFISRNFLLTFDREFQLISTQEIIESLPRERYESGIVRGLEDCRLFEWEKQLWFTCTILDTNFSGIPQIALCKLEETQDFQIEVSCLIPLNGPDPFRCEKNWLPFVENNELKLIYLYHPFTIYKPNLLTGNSEILLEYEPSHDFSLFRGSAGPLSFENGYLLLIHELVAHKDSTRTYLHRFIYLDQNYIVKQVSKPFTFLHQGVEFCGSMTFDHSKKTLILALGIEDEKAYLCFTDIDLIRTLLYPLKPNF